MGVWLVGDLSSGFCVLWLLVGGLWGFGFCGRGAVPGLFRFYGLTVWGFRPSNVGVVGGLI